MYTFLIPVLFQIVLGEVIVNTSTGPVRGVSSLADDVEVFLSIPYAEPPVGKLRFAKPLPINWTQILNASTFPPLCPQPHFGHYYFLPDSDEMSENCLYLNVWSPKSSYAHGLRPVIIYIHPGAFTGGSSNMPVYDGSYFASRGNVVVVTLNHRLGPPGFLFADNEEASGDMGMYDQIAAIKWMKENAKEFSGDPENIVLMGSSTGGYSITAHMLSPLSMNLFKRVIIQSGTILHPFLFDDNERLYQNSQLISSIVGCSNKTNTLKKDPQSVVECLTSKSIEEIIGAVDVVWKTDPAMFLPSVNGEFLPKNPVFLLREGSFRKDIDVMIGINKDEGSIMLTAMHPDDFGGVYGKDIEEVMNKRRVFSLSRSAFPVIGQRKYSDFMDYYTSLVRRPSTTEYVKMLSNIIGDFAIACGTVFFADFVSLKGNSVYFYKFEFRAASTPMAEWVGVTHLDEIQYVFGIPYHKNFTAAEVELSHRMIDRWASFARTGDPNIPGHVPWLQYSYWNPLYLNFGQEEESIRLKPNERCEIWRETFNSEFDPELIQFLQDSAINTTNTPFH